MVSYKDYLKFIGLYDEESYPGIPHYSSEDYARVLIEKIKVCYIDQLAQTIQLLPYLNFEEEDQKKLASELEFQISSCSSETYEVWKGIEKRNLTKMLEKIKEEESTE